MIHGAASQKVAREATNGKGSKKNGPEALSRAPDRDGVFSSPPHSEKPEVSMRCSSLMSVSKSATGIGRKK